jgi:hypothetical protein
VSDACVTHCGSIDAVCRWNVRFITDVVGQWIELIHKYKPFSSTGIRIRWRYVQETASAGTAGTDEQITTHLQQCCWSTPYAVEPEFYIQSIKVRVLVLPVSLPLPYSWTARVQKGVALQSPRCFRHRETMRSIGVQKNWRWKP